MSDCNNNPECRKQNIIVTFNDLRLEVSMKADIEPVVWERQEPEYSMDEWIDQDGNFNVSKSDDGIYRTTVTIMMSNCTVGGNYLLDWWYSKRASCGLLEIYDPCCARTYQLTKSTLKFGTKNFNGKVEPVSVTFEGYENDSIQMQNAIARNNAGQLG